MGFSLVIMVRSEFSFHFQSQSFDTSRFLLPFVFRGNEACPVLNKFQALLKPVKHNFGFIHKPSVNASFKNGLYFLVILKQLQSNARPVDYKLLLALKLVFKQA